VSTQTSSEIGVKLRTLRNERGYSLSQVARATRISRSFIGLVEGGKSDITITRLMRLALFYGVHIADVLPDAVLEDRLVVRRGEGQRVYSPKEQIDVSLLSMHTERAMSPILATFAPQGESEISTHEGEEFLYVLSGRFELQLGENEPIVVAEGDSIHFPAVEPHTYKNIGETEGQLLSVVTPAIF
jgi:quercetin dioxygenase-like cupin family protein